MVDNGLAARLGLYGAAGFNPAAPKDAGGNTLLVQNGYKPNGSTFESKVGTGTRRPGQQGRCYDFDGTDDYVALSTALRDVVGANGTWSVSWSMIPTIPGTGMDTVWDSSNGTLNRVQVELHTSSSLRCTTYDGAFSNVSGTITSGANHQCTLTCNGGTLALYIDGVLQTGTSGATTQVGTSFNVGANTGGSNTYDGKMFGFYIYDDILTADEITWHASYGRLGTDPGTANLQALFKMDEQSGTTAYDSSGNGYHGTITNATLSTFHATQDVYSFQNEVGYTQGKNYVKYSTDIGQLPWGASNITITDNQADPDGGTAAQKFEVASTASAVISQLAPLAAVNDGNHCFSFYVKAITGGTDGGAIYLRNNTSGINIAYGNLDFSTGVLTVSAGAGSATDVGDGWYLLQIYSDQISAGDTLRVYLGWPGGTQDAGEAIYAYAPQLEEGTARTTYQPTGNYSFNSGILIPRDESNTTLDVIGNTLQYTGVRPNDGALINSNALTLNGTNQAVRVTDNTDLDITDNLTVMFWAKNANASLVASEVIAAKYDFANNRREWGVYIDTNQRLNVDLGDPADGTFAGLWKSTTAVTLENVTHYAFTFSSGSLAVYVNGLEIAGSVTSGSIPATLYNNTADLTWGSSLSSNSVVNHWEGQIFDARIYDGTSTVLTADEILSIYQNPTSNITFSGQTLAAHYKLAEGASDSAYDSSGNGNHGTIENAGGNW